MKPRSPEFTLRLDHGAIPPPGGPVKTRLAVRGVVDRGGKLLMVRSALGDWKFPGGGVEPRETPEEALAREILEETGYEAPGPFRLAGRAIERSEGRDVPGSLFEMESRYYYAAVEGPPGALNLDAYEQDLGFTPAWVTVQEALATNRKLGASGRADLPPWLERETRVLEWLARGWARPAADLRLENDWVLVRPVDPIEDGPALWQAASPGTNGEDLFQFSLATGPFDSEPEFMAHLSKKASNPLEPTLAVGSKRLGRLVGCVSLLNVRPDHGSLEVGSIWYTKAAQRSEVNTNVMYLLFCHIFEDLGYRRLEWKCHNENEPSKAAALRLGFTPEGVFRQHFWDKGRNRDTAWFSIIDSDWPAVKRRFTELLAKHEDVDRGTDRYQ